MLKELFTDTAKNYSGDTQLIEQLWNELVSLYSGKKRYYHSLSHLENMLKRLTEVKEHISDWHTVVFSLFYHDSIYNAKKSDNEEQSALLAEKRLKELHVPTEMIESCKRHILATKSHNVQEDTDANYFTDADLSVLGEQWEIYRTYAENVRKEYSIYPDVIYNPGRKKVLQHFLGMERIFKTDYFHEKLENRAKENLSREEAFY